MTLYKANQFMLFEIIEDKLFPATHAQHTAPAIGSDAEISLLLRLEKTDLLSQPGNFSSCRIWIMRCLKSLGVNPFSSIR